MRMLSVTPTRVALLFEEILSLYKVTSTGLIIKNQLPNVIELENYEISGKVR